MNISAILQEILERCPHDCARDNKVSRPYYKDRKQHVEQTFAPLFEESALRVKTLPCA